MLDIKFIRENREAVKKAAADKKITVDIDRLLAIDDERRRLIFQVDEYRSRKNKISEAVEGEINENRKKELVKEAQVLKLESEEAERRLKEAIIEYGDLLLRVPNVPSPEAPVGPDDSFSREVYRRGEIPEFNFPVKDHVELGEQLDVLDLSAGAKTAGYRGYYLKNEGVLLHWGLIWHAVKKMLSRGFEPFWPPTLVKEFALVGSGHFPADREEIYEIAGEKSFLAGTAEPSLLAFYADKVLDEKNLPVKIFGVSPCYRSEVGSYGRETRGIFRVHEFMKVEQVVLCRADIEEAKKRFKEILEIAEEILNDLKLPYRVVDVATGGMGAGKYRMFDVETYMPSRGFSETHSSSFLTDWQARRLNIKYRDGGGETKHVYTLNNTAIASPRILIAVLENNQRADGSVVVPEVLREYVGKEIITPKKRG